MLGVKMDDLDHSMHIAENDWTCFYEESEECCLLQPSLACPDNSSLSDSEDSGNSNVVFSKGQLEPQQGFAANSDEAESSTAGYCKEEGQINLSGSGEEQDDLTGKGWVKYGMCLDYPAGNAINIDETNDDITTILQTEQLNVRSPDGEEDEDMPTERDSSSTHEPDPLSYNPTELHVSETLTKGRAVSSVPLRTEKERWFVTVSDSPARQRVPTASQKKKRRQKKPHKNNDVCRTPGQEKARGNGLDFVTNKDSEGDRDTESVPQLRQNNSERAENPEGVQAGAITDESNKLSTVTRNKHDPCKSASTSHSTLTPQDPSRLDNVEPEKLGESTEFLSTHSYDSENYLSANESEEKPQYLQMEIQQLSEKTDAEDAQDRDTLSATAINCEGYESTEPSPMFPSVAKSVNKMPDDNSTCDNDKRASQLSHTPALQQHEINLPASACSLGDRLPVPDVTLTPCSAADSPETYAISAGHTRPVYAISAFWDEMEKLTINDILQLRMGRSTPPRDAQETVAPSLDDFPTNHSSLVDTAEYNLSDVLMDTSDTADSDYFTQPDESKPDRSSCEFSTSDFEEDYWQFLGASRNPSPEPQSKTQQRTGDSCFPTQEEEESTASDGKETPVPSEDFAGDSNAFISSELAWPRQITKSKSVRNVQALNIENLSLLGHDEGASLEENVLFKAINNLGTPAPCLSNTEVLDEHSQISLPEVFEYLEKKSKRDSGCVTVYDPEDISVTPAFEYTLCTFRDETSFFFHNKEKLIPIFSCSHPTIRELTFPDYAFMSAEVEDDSSPIRVAYPPLIQGSVFRTSAAPGGFWRSLLSTRKVSFHNKGSIWCRGSGAWVFPVEAEAIETAEAPMTVLAEGCLSSTPSQSYRQLQVQRMIFETVQTTRREGIFSTLRQSDMCLVCIAFASWVLRSSDPEAADAWKAALLANVSALSAIQYLRQYVKKKTPSQDDP